MEANSNAPAAGDGNGQPEGVTAKHRLHEAMRGLGKVLGRDVLDVTVQNVSNGERHRFAAVMTQDGKAFQIVAGARAANALAMVVEGLTTAQGLVQNLQARASGGGNDGTAPRPRIQGTGIVTNPPPPPAVP